MYVKKKPEPAVKTTKSYKILMTQQREKIYLEIELRIYYVVTSLLHFFRWWDV